MSTQLVKPMIPIPPIFGDNFKIYTDRFTTDVDIGPSVPSNFADPATYNEISTDIPGDPSSHFNVPLDGSYNQSIDADIYLYTNVPTGSASYSVVFGMRFYDIGGVPFTPPTPQLSIDPIFTTDGLMFRFTHSLPKGHPYVEGRLVWGVSTAGVVKWGWDATAQAATGATGSQPLIWRIISWK